MSGVVVYPHVIRSPTKPARDVLRTAPRFSFHAHHRRLVMLENPQGSHDEAKGLRRPESTRAEAGVHAMAPDVCRGYITASVRRLPPWQQLGTR